MLRGLVSILFFFSATFAAIESDSDVGPVQLAADRVRDWDSGPPELSSSGSLPFFYDLHTFRGDAGGTMVVTAVAVPVGGLHRERTNGRFRYRFDVRFVLADTMSRSVSETVDSVFVSLQSPLAGQHLIHTYVEVEAPPSTTTLQRVVVTDATTPGVGQLYDSPFSIPDYSGTELMISDIAFGLPDALSGWTRRGVTLALLPTSQFPESSFDVYYEIYNLPAGNQYETEIAIEPLDDDEGTVVRAGFSGESAAGADDSLGELRRVESALPEGRYRLTVTVTDKVTGQVAANSRVVQVQGWRSGATMVLALPKRGLGPER